MVYRALVSHPTVVIAQTLCVYIYIPNKSYTNVICEFKNILVKNRSDENKIHN